MEAAPEKVRALVGLALRSRAAALGREACKHAARRGKLRALLLAADAGVRVARDCGWAPPVPLLQAGCDKRALGALVGRTELAAIGITEEHLAAGLIQYALPFESRE